MLPCVLKETQIWLLSRDKFEIKSQLVTLTTQIYPHTTLTHYTNNPDITCLSPVLYL